MCQKWRSQISRNTTHSLRDIWNAICMKIYDIYEKFSYITELHMGFHFIKIFPTVSFSSRLLSLHCHSHTGLFAPSLPRECAGLNCNCRLPRLIQLFPILALKCRQIERSSHRPLSKKTRAAHWRHAWMSSFEFKGVLHSLQLNPHARHL